MVTIDTPKSCMIMSALMAPGDPRRLCTVPSEAWFQLGSPIDQVAQCDAESAHHREDHEPAGFRRAANQEVARAVGQEMHRRERACAHKPLPLRDH